MKPLQWVVVGLAWICAGVALGCVVLLLLDLRRDPPAWWVRRHIPEPDSPKWREPQKASRR